MEVTKENYYQIEPKILEDINNSEFIAFDLEFSGLIPSKFKIYDSAEEDFKKSKIQVENYRIIQIGLTPFIKKKDSNNSYIAKPYNIYVFPSEKQSNNKCDFYVESILFNKEHNCDFNKWIKDGVSYLNNEQIDKLKDRFGKGSLNKYEPKDDKQFKNIVLYKDSDKILYKNFLDKFNEFYNNPEVTIFKHEKFFRHILLYFLNNISKEVRNTIFIESKDDYIYIYKLNSVEEKNKKIDEENNELLEMIKKEKGVKTIIEQIVKSEKPIVGHNCFIDLLFIMNYFFEPIPGNFYFFKCYLLTYFPGGIYDTKLLYNMSKLNFSCSENEGQKGHINLEGLFKGLIKENDLLSSDKKILIEIPKDEGFINYLEDFEKTSKFHQADYDSFTTGSAFIFMKNLLGVEYINELKNKLNCYHGLYEYYDLKSKEDIYLKKSTDIYILNYKDTYYSNGKVVNDIENEIIKSPYVNLRIRSKDIKDGDIILINSENKNNFFQLCSKYVDYFAIKTISEFKEELKLKNSH